MIGNHFDRLCDLVENILKSKGYAERAVRTPCLLMVSVSSGFSRTKELPHVNMVTSLRSTRLKQNKSLQSPSSWVYILGHQQLLLESQWSFIGSRVSIFGKLSLFGRTLGNLIQESSVPWLIFTKPTCQYVSGLLSLVMTNNSESYSKWIKLILRPNWSRRITQHFELWP